MENGKLKIILSGGGTGGHIYPSVAVAEALRRELGDGVELLFVGAEGKMEMEKLPALGYRVVGLPVAGLQRKLDLRNFALPFKVMKSIREARRTIRAFGADAAAGFGGYASAPVLWAAQHMGIPTLIQEQNSYAGVTNKLLAKQASKICVAYEGMERFFDKEKIILTGNPVRQGLLQHNMSREDAVRSFQLDPAKKTVLIIGGSLGARTINNCVMQGLDKIRQSGVQFIWQTGKIYISEARAAVSRAGELPMLHTTDFIADMAAAYRAADLVISRAGAGSISELCLLGKPVILVPSPNVAEDHQTKNALALVNKEAALYVKDAEAGVKLLDTAIATVQQPDTLNKLSTNIAKLAFKDSANVIAGEVWKLAATYRKEHGR